MINKLLEAMELIKNTTTIIVGVFSIFGVIIAYLTYRRKSSKKEPKKSIHIKGDNNKVVNNSVNIKGINNKSNVNISNK